MNTIFGELIALSDLWRGDPMVLGDHMLGTRILSGKLSGRALQGCSDARKSWNPGSRTPGPHQKTQRKCPGTPKKVQWGEMGKTTRMRFFVIYWVIFMENLFK